MKESHGKETPCRGLIVPADFDTIKKAFSGAKTAEKGVIRTVYFLKGRLAMRHELEKAIGGELRLLAIRTRNTLKITQKDMAETLCMSESFYSDIETGKFHRGMLTYILLLCMQSDTNVFFDTVRGICEEQERFLLLDSKEVQPL